MGLFNFLKPKTANSQTDIPASIFAPPVATPNPVPTPPLPTPIPPAVAAAAAPIPSAQELDYATTVIADAKSALERVDRITQDQLKLRQMGVYLSNDPLRYQMPHDPRFRPYSPLTTDALRTLARTNDIAGRCIAHLKSEVTKVPIKIVPKDEKDKRRAVLKGIDAANFWFSEDGGLGGAGVKRAVFEGQLIDDLAVIGACTLHLSFDTVGDLIDGIPSEVRAIDAATIRPLVTPFGFPVGNDGKAFEQWVQGVPTGKFDRLEMIYEGLPSFARSDSPYWMSPTEQAAMQLYTLMRVDEWNRAFLTDGSGYKRWLKTNESITPEQAMAWLEIMELQTVGNAAQRHKIGLAPGEITGEESRKDQDFDGFEHTRIERICSSYHVNPASIGHHSQQYKDSQEAAMDSTREGLVAELLLWRKDLYDRLLARKGWDFLEVVEDVPTPAESPQERTTRQGADIAGGVKTINQVRQENGDDPVEGGDELLVPSNLQPLSRLLAPPPAPDGVPGGDPTSDPAQGPASDSVPATPPTTARVELANALERGSVHDFGCVMVTTQPIYESRLARWAKEQNLALSGDGVVDDPHVTVLYGIHDPNPAPVAEVFHQAAQDGQALMRAKVGKLMVFRSRGKEGQSDFDVLVHKVDSPDLVAMNKRLKALEHTSTFPNYVPHLTIAYLQPGGGDAFEGQDGPLTGETLTFDSLCYSNQDGKKFDIDASGTARLEKEPEGPVALDAVEPQDNQVERALSQWQRKCVKRLERGKSHIAAFDSDVLSESLRNQVVSRLESLVNPDKSAIRSAFEGLI